MGQADVYEFLKRNKDEWYTVKTLSKKLGIPESSVIVSTRKLRHQNLIASRVTRIKFNKQGYACNEHRYLEETEREFITRCKTFRVKEKKKPKTREEVIRWKKVMGKNPSLLD